MARGGRGDAAAAVTPVVTRELVARLEAREVVPQVQLSSWAPQGTVAALAAAGFTPAWCRSVHAQRLTAWDGSGIRLADDVATEQVGREELDVFAATLLSALRDEEHRPDEGDTARALAEHDDPGVVQLLARCDGEPAGAALMTVLGDEAFFGPAGTLPLHRRRGVQLALLVERLRLAREAGVELAFVTAVVDSSTVRNVERLGFTLVQQQWVLRRA